MKRYLLNVTFCAGSDDARDVDKGLYLLDINKDITQQQMKDVFSEVNHLLDPYNYEEENEFPISYEDGLNIDTFMNGIEIYTKGKVFQVHNNCGSLNRMDNYYEIEQWQ